MQPPSTCDVLIAGGGPAGAMAATYLAQQGRDVVLMERRRHPRPMVGESLIPEFWKFCDLAGVSDEIAAEGFIVKAGGTVDWDGERSRISFADYGYTRPALHVERERFDEILFRRAGAAGATLFENMAVQDANADAGDEHVVAGYRSTVTGEGGEVRARYFIDATGQAAVLGRRLGLRRIDDEFRFVALWGYFEGSGYMAADGGVYACENAPAVPPTTYVTELPFGGAGWSWHIMLRGKASVGLIVPADVIKQIKANGGDREAFFHEQCQSLPALAELLKGSRFVPGSLSFMNNYSFTSDALSAPRCFLIGDASGFIDPIFSIGVVLAMYGAHIAAWAIDRSLRDASREATSRAMFDAQLASRMELSRSLALPTSHAPAAPDPQLVSAMSMFSGSNKALMNAVASMTGRGQNFSRMTAEA